MKYRIIALVPAVVAVVGSTLVAPPAQAASAGSVLKSTSIAISAAGQGKVAIQCKTSKRCKGTLRFGGSTKTTAYNVRGKKTVYAPVALPGGDPANPRNGVSVGGQFKRKTGQKLVVRQTAPKKKSTTYTVTTETALALQEITGRIMGVGGSRASDIRVELLRGVRGGNTQVVAFANGLSDGSRFVFRRPLGPNNSPSGVHQLRISAKDQNGIVRSWFWRGSDGRASVGGRYLREASPVQAAKTSDFNADFRFSSLEGTAPSGTSVTAVAPPASFSGGSSVIRELDFSGCGNVFGETTARGGRYRIDFLPYLAGDRRYMVSARAGSVDAWYGRPSTQRFGSCFDVGNYTRSVSNLLALDSAEPTTRNVDVSASGIDVVVDGKFSGFSASAQGDRWLRLRERTPGVPILDAPVVAERMGNAKGDATFRDVPPGNYWVELGRRTGCSAWYPSRFANNKAYLAGEDRGQESWKSFRTLSGLSGGKNSGLEGVARRANPNPATDAQNKVPSGAAGWMYRSHCKANGAGTFVKVNIADDGRSSQTKSVSLTSSKGATVRGRVTRTGGRTNKEMLVRVSSTDGVRVLRTAMTDGSGRFTISGLPSGRWTVAVNTDSWRGIGRSFTGKHAVRVKAGKSYSVGTLRFRG